MTFDNLQSDAIPAHPREESTRYGIRPRRSVAQSDRFTLPAPGLHSWTLFSSALSLARRCVVRASKIPLTYIRRLQDQPVQFTLETPQVLQREGALGNPA